LASTFIDLPESLRPWRQAGLRVLQRPYSVEWEHYFKRHLKPAKTVWTYMELGNDLSGKSSALRSQTLRDIMAYLSWPRGAVGFWPIAIPKGDRLTVELNIFWLGVRLMQAEYIVSFGEDALTHLSPISSPLMAEHKYQHLSFFSLPPIEALASMDTDQRQETLAVLKNIQFAM